MGRGFGLILLCAGLGACGRSAPLPAPAATRAAVRVYHMRGVVVGLPEEKGGARELMIRHEPVDDWTDPTGEGVGMDSMTMGFPLAEDEGVGDAKVGDKIAFDFVVDLAGGKAVVRGVKVLPADTALRFGAAKRAATR